MEIRYSREMNHNYMIIEAPEEETGYAVQMLSANAIEGLLKFRVRQTEEAREYYYEITSRQPLRRVLEKRTLSGQELRSILLGVLAVLKRVEEYLLGTAFAGSGISVSGTRSFYCGIMSGSGASGRGAAGALKTAGVSSGTCGSSGSGGCCISL